MNIINLSDSLWEIVEYNLPDYYGDEEISEIDDLGKILHGEVTTKIKKDSIEWLKLLNRYHQLQLNVLNNAWVAKEKTTENGDKISIKKIKTMTGGDIYLARKLLK